MATKKYVDPDIVSALESIDPRTRVNILSRALVFHGGTPTFLSTDGAWETVPIIELTHENHIFWFVLLRGYAQIKKLVRNDGGLHVHSAALMECRHQALRPVTSVMRGTTLELRLDSPGWEECQLSQTFRDLMNTLQRSARPLVGGHADSITSVRFAGHDVPFMHNRDLAALRGTFTIDELLAKTSERGGRPSRQTTPAHEDPASGTAPFVTRPV